MSLQIRNIINNEDIDTSSLKLDRTYRKMLQKYPGITEGEHVVVQCDFTNADVINRVATYVLKQDIQFNELKIDFFDSVKKIDWFDPYKYVRGANAIFNNWENFLIMFKLRHELIHEMEYTRLSYHKIASMCDNTMNFLDATMFIFQPEFREDVIDRLKSNKALRQRNLIIDRALRNGKVDSALLNTIYE